MSDTRISSPWSAAKTKSRAPCKGERMEDEEVGFRWDVKVVRSGMSSWGVL